MKNARPSQVYVESDSSESDKPWGEQRDPLLDRHEEFSHIRTDACFGPYSFTLRAYGGGNPQILVVSIYGLPGVRLDIVVDRDGIERLAGWFLKAKNLLDQLRKQKESEIDLAIKKSKRVRTVPEKLLDWEKDVSQIQLKSLFDECDFKLRAYGMGMPSEILTISVRSVSKRKMKQVSIDRGGVKKLGKWLLDCLFLLDWLRKRKEANIADALTTRRKIIRHREC
jgi:hypothetical protein